MNQENMPGNTLENVLGSYTADKSRKKNRNVLEVINPVVVPFLPSLNDEYSIEDTLNYLRTLFGYKIIIDGDLVILKSNFQKDDIFNFKIVNRQRIQVIDLQGEKYQHYYDKYIFRGHYIPAFFSAITL